MWVHIKNWFTENWHIETIMIARIKLIAGTLFTAVQQSGVDLAGFVENPKAQIAIRVMFAWLIVDGTLTEWARRRGATDIQ